MIKHRIAVIALATTLLLAAGCENFVNKPTGMEQTQKTADETEGDEQESIGDIPVNASIDKEAVKDKESAEDITGTVSASGDSTKTDKADTMEEKGDNKTDKEDAVAADKTSEVKATEDNTVTANETEKNKVDEITGTSGKESSGLTANVSAENLPASYDISSPFANTKYGSPYLADGSLSNKKYGWYTNRNNNHQPTSPPYKDFDVLQLGGYYLGDYSSKTVYLTFDEGYEEGYTERILDVLKEKNVKAAFFVTKPYIKSNIELCKRMIEEGHLVCNHTVSHKSMPDLDDDTVRYELEETERYFKEVTGCEMSKYFRPPMGEYSARTLKLVSDMGIKSIFWSFAHRDWLVDEQPSVAETYKVVMDNLHNGSIMLLHAVSKSNTEALPEIIDSVIGLGFEFKSLDEL